MARDLRAYAASQACSSCNGHRIELVLAIALLNTAKLIEWQNRWFPGWVHVFIEL